MAIKDSQEGHVHTALDICHDNVSILIGLEEVIWIVPTLRERRVTAGRERLPGEVGEPGDARENNAAAEPATLTPLGERLLGSRPW